MRFMARMVAKVAPAAMANTTSATAATVARLRTKLRQACTVFETRLARMRVPLRMRRRSPAISSAVR